MPKKSAALLAFRVSDRKVLEVLIVHPGGPFWAKKDLGAWSIPKGEYEDAEDAEDAAFREFQEEVGVALSRDTKRELGEIKQPSGKIITTFAVNLDVDLRSFKSNDFEMEWPKGSGKIQSFPEVDRAEWFSIAEARRRLLKGHVAFLDRLSADCSAQGISFIEEPVAQPDSTSAQEALF